MHRVARAVPLVVLLLISSEVASAGHNAGASALLTWSQETIQSDLATVPPQRFPLFLRLTGLTDVVRLAVDLRWSQEADGGPCFRIEPGDSSGTECGWNSAAPPGGGFGGDTSYTWTINFPPGCDKDCLEYWIEGLDCETVPASFCLASVLALDSAGLVDTLFVKNATLLGGTPAACPAPLEPQAADAVAVTPRVFASGRTSVVTVTGRGFDADTWVRFRDHTGQLLPSEVGFATSDTLRAAFVVPEASTGPVSMELTQSDGASASIDSIGLAVVPEFYVTILVDGVPVAPLDIESTDAGGPLCPTALHAPSVFRTQPSVIKPASGCQGLNEVIRSNTVTYIVHRSWDDAVLTNCNASITVSAWPNSGGHCHDDATRPYGSPQMATGNTGADGQQFQVTHTWPQVSGYLLIQLAPDDACLARGGYSENLWVPVRGPDPESSSAGLIELPAGFAYTKEGGPDNVTRHPDNHYGTPELVATLQNMAYLWGGAALGRPDFGYNDMSLMWGGVFDAQTTTCPRPPDWVSPCHCFHRDGMHVDFKITHLTLDERKRADLIVRKFFYPRKEGDHWHLRLTHPSP